MSRKKKNRITKKAAKSTLLTGVSHVTTAIGYVVPNTFLYLEGLLAALGMIIDVLKHQLTTDSGVNVDISSFFVDSIGYVSFGLAILAILSLTASNQLAYAGMIKELWNRSSKKGTSQKELNKLSPEDLDNIQKFLTDLKDNQSTNIENIKNFLEELKNNKNVEKIKEVLNKFADEDIAKVETIEKILEELMMEEAKQPEERRSLWQSFRKFLKIFANLLGTHVKAFVTVAATWRTLERLIQRPYLTGAVTSLIILPCAELAQFAILGRKQDKEVFKGGLISFGVTTVATVLSELLVTFAFGLNTAALAAISTCAGTLLGSTLVIAGKESNLFGLMVDWIKEDWCGSTKQPILPIYNDENNEKLTSQNKSSWWNYWCCWRTEKNLVAAETGGRFYQVPYSPLKPKPEDSGSESDLSVKSFNSLESF